MRILIADDSKTMRMIVKRALRQAGFESHSVEEVGNGAEALQSIRASCPDVVLCDWNMPEMNGLELLKTLKTDGIQVKFGFVTSEGTPEMQQTAAEAGALFVITKPFTAETFQSILGPVLQ